METASVEVKNVKRTRAESESGSEASAGNARKRGRRTKAEVEVELEAKRVKLTSVGETRGIGQVLTLGQGDTGQLGLGEDVMEKSRPALVKDIEAAVEVVAGGMHTAVLDSEGQVWTFGCNDEGSLGRVVAEEEDCFVPGKVEIEEKVVGISAGDSHSAALTETGISGDWRLPDRAELNSVFLPLRPGLGVGHLQRQQRPHRAADLGPAGEDSGQGGAPDQKRGRRGEGRLRGGPPRPPHQGRGYLDTR